MRLSDALKINEKTVCGLIEKFIRKKVREFERDGVLIGISGGIDSAVCAYLAVRALGKQRVFGLLLPERDVPEESFESAKLVVSKLGIKHKVENLTKVLEAYNAYKLVRIPGFTRKMKERVVKFAHDFYYKKTGRTPFSDSLLGIKKVPYSNLLRKALAYMRIKHRARAVAWYKEAEIRNLLVLGCCNKTEKLVGWFVKYGDSASDVEPIAGLYKTQVWQLARYLNVPESIIKRIPTPDMLPGITDEYGIGLNYETLDLILYGIEKKIPDKSIAKELCLNLKTINYVKLLIRKSAHMRQLPPSPCL